MGELPLLVESGPLKGPAESFENRCQPKELTARVGASLGPLVGGWLYDAVGRNTPFYINGALLILSAAWVLLLLDNRSPSSALEVG